MPPGLGGWDSAEALVAQQDEQLAVALEWAARSPFYQARFDAGVTPRNRVDLAALPLTTKQDLRDNYPFGMLAVPMRRLATYHESSGSAGTPTASYYTAEDWVDVGDRYARKWVGITAADMLLVRTPYALMITGHMAQEGARGRGATVVPADNRSLLMPTSRVLRLLHDLPVTLTWSLPTATLMWARAAGLAGLRPDTDFPELRALFVGGEPLSSARQARISQLWGVPVVNDYGSTETGPLAGQCRHGTLHLWADRAIFEVYDPVSGRITAQGRGQLVVTPLYRQAMPLLRYNVADQVEISYEDCPCGWRLPSVRVLGRAGFGYRVGGRLVQQVDIEQAVFTLPARHEVMFWRARVVPTGLEVQIEVPDREREAARAALRTVLERDLGVPAQVDGCPPGTLVSDRVLTEIERTAKPRALFDNGEDWDEALQ
ncbi:phenylacetate--CoA ligase family protein [Actinophytocola sp. S1-96]|uniref:Phenylacetate--CoA ligase family protein n=1 Tax=Actinophytocola gossypii TaxID=2812003 RepID=A0ABT2J1Q5_9PSEU|nr:phenylacetate--CoA ligase family protein [Actinophytocola gossypii]